MSEASFAFLLRFSPLVLASLGFAAAGTDWPAARSLGPLSGLDGFEEEYRLWWPLLHKETAALGAVESVVKTGVCCDTVATARLTDELIMVTGMPQTRSRSLVVTSGKLPLQG
jgi:hypothetical protein